MIRKNYEKWSHSSTGPSLSFWRVGLWAVRGAWCCTALLRRCQRWTMMDRVTCLTGKVKQWQRGVFQWRIYAKNGLTWFNLKGPFKELAKKCSHWARSLKSLLKACEAFAPLSVARSHHFQPRVGSPLPFANRLWVVVKRGSPVSGGEARV